ncbi:hypothetical protein DV737_g5294, partial [Chaetothyriales sp. CBS 132003]
MPPKRVPIAPASRRSPPPKGYLSGAYHTLTSEENRSVVVSVGLFAEEETDEEENTDANTDEEESTDANTDEEENTDEEKKTPMSRNKTPMSRNKTPTSKKTLG